VSGSLSKTAFEGLKQEHNLIREIRGAFAAIRHHGAWGSLRTEGHLDNALSQVVAALGFRAYIGGQLSADLYVHTPPPFDVGFLLFHAENDNETAIQQLLVQLRPGAWIIVAAMNGTLTGNSKSLLRGHSIQVEKATPLVLWGRKALSLGLSPSERGTGIYERIKPIADCVIGTVLLLATLPLQLLIGLLIKLTSPGPTIFCQTRVGRDGKLFTFYKFRTMWVDARERFPHMYDYRFTSNQIATMTFKSEDDPRHTPFGRWLRKSSLDELPNLINVIRGDISLIGPRPDIPEMVGYYRPNQLTKLSVKPGVTGLAQARGRGDLTFQQTLMLDLEYVQAYSLWTDLNIIKETIQCLLARTGAK
jgi:lipopolysaccharide/colanic/teichoic acid biosynthesis glycosyltransferase